MIMARRPDPRRHKDAKRANASGDNGLNDPTHPLYAMMLKLVDNAQEKGFKNIDLQKDRWTEAKAKDLKPDEIYRVKSDWLADQIANGGFSGISEIDKAHRFCSLLDGNERLRMSNQLLELEKAGNYSWGPFVESWMFPEGKAAATEVVRAKVQRKCGENETMHHYLESKVELMRRLKELCPLEAQKQTSLRELELINSFREGLYIASHVECAATRVFRALTLRSGEPEKPQLTVTELRKMVVDVEHQENLLMNKRPAMQQSRYRASASNLDENEFQAIASYSRMDKGDAKGKKGGSVVRSSILSHARNQLPVAETETVITRNEKSNITERNYILGSGDHGADDRVSSEESTDEIQAAKPKTKRRRQASKANDANDSMEEQSPPSNPKKKVVRAKGQKARKVQRDADEADDSDDAPISRASMMQMIRELQPKFMAASDERETGGKGYANNGGGKGLWPWQRRQGLWAWPWKRQRHVGC
jgi:hypothetical protein